MKLTREFFLYYRGEDYREDVHTGTYHCQARNKYGVILSRTVEVHGGMLHRTLIFILFFISNVAIYTLPN